jgi:hypothetical protein
MSHAEIARLTRLVADSVRDGPIGFAYLQGALWAERAPFEAVVRDLESRGVLTWVKGVLTLIPPLTRVPDEQLTDPRVFLCPERRPPSHVPQGRERPVLPSVFFSPHALGPREG